jgi:demethylmenaquinone methyltransferase/2-methoxy-6-polyprenyl-1,4-benzoquinol methylase
LGRLIPLVSRWATGDKEAATLMRYYWDTVDHCVPAQTIVSALLEADFSHAGVTKELGIFNAYSACKL